MFFQVALWEIQKRARHRIPGALVVHLDVDLMLRIQREATSHRNGPGPERTNVLDAQPHLIDIIERESRKRGRGFGAALWYSDFPEVAHELRVIDAIVLGDEAPLPALNAGGGVHDPE